MRGGEPPGRADLDLPVELAICPTVREADGLAMSSRNVRLRGDDRERALALVEGLDAAGRRPCAAGETNSVEVERVATKAMLPRGVGPDYVAVVDPTTLAPLEQIDGHALMVVAAHVGRSASSTTPSWTATDVGPAPPRPSAPPTTSPPGRPRAAPS